MAPAAVVVSAVDSGGVARPLLVLVAACLVPGGALLTRLGCDDLLSACGFAVGLSLCIETVGALVMIWTGWWHPLGFSLVLMAMACAVLAVDLGRAFATLGGGRDGRTLGGRCGGGGRDDRTLGGRRGG
ncbi:MAG TPA: hypothetical protein VNY52_06285, partial [Solirubrobacteraceae bacterium]|nr:hypothetical protein [Solirubrobacteraceae bacterium]